MLADETITREVARVEYHNDRARQFALPATLTIDQWIGTLNHFQWACAYCLGPYEVLEHFIPLTLQGETSAVNCLPACYACNARKQSAHPGALSWIAPPALLYLRSYFSSLHAGVSVPPRNMALTAREEKPDAIYTIGDLTIRFQVSEKTIRRLIAQEKIYGTLIQGIWRFSELDILSFARSVTALHTLQEVAARLDVCEKTIRRWVHTHQLEVIEIGRQLRFEEKEIKRFMDLRRRARVKRNP